MRLLVSAGEASGDAYGAQLVRRMLERCPTLEVEAIGGPRLEEAGARVLVPTSRWGAIGVIESVRVGPRVVLGFLKALRIIARGEPGLFLPIDYGFVNVKLAKKAKAGGWKVLYFIPPGSWRRDRQGRSMPLITDEIVTPFPWSAEILNGMGATARFYGHPLVDMAAEAPDPDQREGIAILPGSRMHEIKANLPVIARALAGLDQKPSITFGAAASVNPKELLARWSELGGPGAEATREIHALLKRSQAGIICSGTATLEAVLCGCPLVVVYRLTPLMKFETLFYKPKFDFAALPNILLGREAFPELLDKAASPQAIRARLAEIMRPSQERRSQIQAIQEVQALAGDPGCLDKTVQRALALLGLSA